MEIKDHRLVHAFNGRLAFTFTLLMLSQLNFGMDQTAFSTTQAMPYFEKKFGVYDPAIKSYEIEPYFLSLLNSLTYIGQVFGVVLGSWVSPRWGRRMSIYTMSVWAVIAAILLVFAQQKEQMLVGRVVNYIYIGQELVTMPVLQSEIVPAHARGFAVGSYQFGVIVGSFVMSLIALGTSKIHSPASYQIPFGIFFIIPVVVAAGTYFVPESPRWLLLQNRPEEALQSLRRYRNGRFSEAEIQEEFEEQVALVSMTTEKGSFKELWRGTNRQRTLIAIGANLSNQLTGQQIASKYSTVILGDIGAVNPFVVTAINTALLVLVVALAMYLLDKVGRRPLLLSGAFLQGASMLVFGGLGTIANPLYSIKVGESSMLPIFFGGYCLGWAPIYHILTAEIPNSRMRDMTFAVASALNVVTQFVVTFVIPYIYYAPYAALGAKIGLIFGPICLATMVFVFFCMPECKGLSLEEIDHLFLQNVPVRHFIRYRHGEVLPEEVREFGEKKARIVPTDEQVEYAAETSGRSGKATVVRTSTAA